MNDTARDSVAPDAGPWVPTLIPWANKRRPDGNGPRCPACARGSPSRVSATATVRQPEWASDDQPVQEGWVRPVVRAADDPRTARPRTRAPGQGRCWAGTRR